MNIHRRSWRRLAAPALALSVALVGAPLPAAAGDVTPQFSPPTSPLAKSVQRVVATTPLAVANPAQASAQQTPQPKSADLNSPSFFKTPGGIVVIGMLAAGTAYALYSMSNDRIRGSGR